MKHDMIKRNSFKICQYRDKQKVLYITMLMTMKSNCLYVVYIWHDMMNTIWMKWNGITNILSCCNIGLNVWSDINDQVIIMLYPHVVDYVVVGWLLCTSNEKQYLNSSFCPLRHEYIIKPTYMSPRVSHIMIPYIYDFPLLWLRPSSNTFL